MITSPRSLLCYPCHSQQLPKKLLRDNSCNTGHCPLLRNAVLDSLISGSSMPRPRKSLEPTVWFLNAPDSIFLQTPSLGLLPVTERIITATTGERGKQSSPLGTELCVLSAYCVPTTSSALGSVQRTCRARSLRLESYF